MFLSASIVWARCFGNIFLLDLYAKFVDHDYFQKNHQLSIQINTKAILKANMTLWIQSIDKVLSLWIISFPWYVTNETMHRDLKIPTVKEEISKFSNRYNTRVNNQQNPLVTQILDGSDPQTKKTIPFRFKH